MNPPQPDVWEIRVTVMVTEDEAEMLADVVSEALHLFRANLPDPYPFFLTVHPAPGGHNSVP